MNNRSILLKNYKKALLLGVIAIVAVCCKSSQSTTSSKSSLDPAQPDVAIASAHWPGTTLDNLKQGYSIYNDKCTECHGTKKPQDFSVDDWNSIMPKMGRNAKLDSVQYAMVFHYILAKREVILGPGK